MKLLITVGLQGFCNLGYSRGDVNIILTLKILKIPVRIHLFFATTSKYFISLPFIQKHITIAKF